METDIIELSDEDSNSSSLISSKSTDETLPYLMNSDVEAIIKKYQKTSCDTKFDTRASTSTAVCNSVNDKPTANDISLSDEDAPTDKFTFDFDDDNYEFGLRIQQSSSNSSSDFAGLDSGNSPVSTSSIQNEECTVKKRRKIDAEEKERKTLQKAEARLQKQQEREHKQRELQKEKELKQTLKLVNKNLKPEECLKLVTVFIDTTLVNSSYGKEIINNLQDGVVHKVQDQMVPNSVTWSRKVQGNLMSDNGQLVLTSDSCEVDQMLLIMDYTDFLNYVNTNTLLAHIKSVQTTYLSNKRISLGIYGLEKHFTQHKRQKTQPKPRADGNLPHVPQRTIEHALTELQLFCSCCYRTLETPQQVGLLVAQFTKAIAQAPYKSDKYEPSECYISDDNKDCVKVDKDGNGLQRLWKQQLCKFPLAKLEASEAILSKYSRPNALMHAYDGCDVQTGQQLLQDVPIRRAAGPVTSARRIGPELSRKVRTFFTALDGDILW